MKKRIAHAKELLAAYEVEKGKIDWSKIKIQCATNLSFSCPNAVLIKDMLKEIGVDVDTLPLDVTEVRGNEVSGSHIISSLALGFDYDDPIDYFGQIWITNAGRSYHKQSVPELDALYQKQSFILAAEERRKIALEMDKIAMNEAGFQLLNWHNYNQVQWNFVKGNTQTPINKNTNARLKYVWLTCDAPTAGC